jgi:hypothetical protein
MGKFFGWSHFPLEHNYLFLTSHVILRPCSWPSFRDEEVVWENVRVLTNSGEVSACARME